MRYLLPLLACLPILTQCKSEHDEVRPHYKPLTEAVYASGFVVSRNEYEIYSQTEGYVVEKLVSAGDRVRKGDVLFILSSNQQVARNRIAEQNLNLARKNANVNSSALQQLAATLQVAKSKKQFDSLNYVRYQNLWAQNAIARIEVDRSRLLFENSREDYHRVNNQYTGLKDQLMTELVGASNNLAIVQDEKERSVIRSEIDGIVFMTAKEKGELVRRSEMIAVAGKGRDYYLKINVDELDIPKVKVSQHVLVQIDAFPGKIFNAIVEKIYPMVDRKLQSVQVDATLTDSLPGNFSGLAVEANIIVNKNDKALIIPKEFLLPGDSVVVKTGRDMRKVKVRTGIHTLNEVEILEGIDTSTVLATIRK